MSLLMDALRKAEEAKKKAELDSKSKSDPVPAQTGAVDKFDEVQTGTKTPPISHPLLEDLAADDDLMGDTAITTENRAPHFADGNQSNPGKLDIEDAAEFELDEFFTQDSTSKAHIEASAQTETEDAIESETEIRPTASKSPGFTNAVDFLTQDKVETDTHLAEFSNSKPEIPEVPVARTIAEGRNSRPMELDSARNNQPAVSVTKVGSSTSATQRIRAQQAAKSAERATQDQSPEDQQRKSAKTIFAAKRNQSALKKNMQVTALGVAAVLIMAIGIYFYINLQTGSGIGTPLAEMDYQQSQRQYTDAELELGDADLGIAAVGAVSADVQPEIASAQDSVISLPDNGVAPDNLTATPDVDLDVAEPVQAPFVSPTEPEIEILAVAPAITSDPNRPADTAIGAANDLPSVATSSTATDVTTDATTDVTTDSTNVATDEPPTEVAPPLSTALSTINVAGVNSAASDAAATSPGIVQLDNSASSAAALQPYIIQPEVLVSFTRRVTAPAGDSLIENAYIAYQNGNFEQAEQLYREALTDAPLNRGALLGLAAIAASRDDTVAALDLYSRLLARDPKDPVAKAGILEIMPGGSLQQQETELRRLREQNPDIAPLAYAFGNFLASQQRWSEAQQAYFSALQLAKNDARNSSVNPDYAFNLAVSLEHLGQSRAAGNYYREALSLAESHPAGFNLGLARERLSRTESAPNG